MFEDSTIESGGRIRTRNKYYTGIGIALNGLVLTALVLVPLLYPEALPSATLTATLIAPPPPLPPPPPPQVIRTTRVQTPEMETPTVVPKRVVVAPDNTPPPSAVIVVGSSDASVPASLFTNSSACPGLVVTPPPIPKKIAISQGVAAGNLLIKTTPTYPSNRLIRRKPKAACFYAL